MVLGNGNAQSYRYLTGMKKDYDVSRFRMKPDEIVAWFDFHLISGEARIYMNVWQRRGDGGYLKYKKYRKFRYTNGVLALIYKARSFNACSSYAPFYSTFEVDVGAHAHSCPYQVFTVQGYGSTFNKKKCVIDFYRSNGRIFKPKTCKKEGSTQMILFRPNGLSLFPIKFAGTTSHDC